MIYHNIYKSWAWTGGHADGDSNLEHVALKEAEEETGLTNLKLLSDGIQVLPVNSHIKKGKYVATHMHLDCCFLWEADENDILRIKADENSGVKWVNINEVLKITAEKYFDNMKFSTYDFELDEPRSDDVKEIVKAKVKQAYSIVKKLKDC